MTDLKLIAGDASDRRFFRFADGVQNAICMEFPRWEGGFGGDPISWIGMQAALLQMGIPVPKIHNIDETKACVWIDDLGDLFLSSILPENILDINNEKCKNAINLYENSLSLLIKAQYPDKDIDSPASNRFFDFEKLYYELKFFVTHFLNDVMNLNIDENNEKDNGLFSDLKFLATKVASFERVLCHRDYHSRNIMVKDNKVYWIDFQDARMGPHAYDVVSLVRDSYVKITWETRNYFFQYYLNGLNERRIQKNLNPISHENFKLEVLFTGLQRNLKAIGSFGYLDTKKNKPNYLKYIKPTLEILCAKESQVLKETYFKVMMPSLFNLINNIYKEDLSAVLDKFIFSKLGID